MRAERRHPECHDHDRDARDREGLDRGEGRQNRGDRREGHGAGGRDGDRRRRAVCHPRDHRLPLAYRGGRRRQRGQRLGVVDGRYQGRDQLRGRVDLSRAGGRRDVGEYPARLGQRDRRADAGAEDAMGQGRGALDLRGRDSGHQVRAGRESEARRESGRRRPRRRRRRRCSRAIRRPAWASRT